jgi:hypothetical protein
MQMFSNSMHRMVVPGVCLCLFLFFSFFLKGWGEQTSLTAIKTTLCQLLRCRAPASPWHMQGLSAASR